MTDDQALFSKGYMEYTEKLAKTSAEISFLSGNAAASTAICEQIEHARRTLCEQKNMTQALQKESLEVQKKAIICAPQHGDKLKDCCAEGK